MHDTFAEGAVSTVNRNFSLWFTHRKNSRKKPVHVTDDSLSVSVGNDQELKQCYDLHIPFPRVHT